jgi:hypothetical protein
MLCAMLENRFAAWLSAVGGREHLWMRDNLEVSLTATLGTSSMLDTDHLAVRVARIDAFSRLFTWAQKLDHPCPSCSEEVALVILSSNAMHYLLRLLQTAVALFETEFEQSAAPLCEFAPTPATS